ncbi:hypothetical protein BH11ACT8_BH11ACT8_11210 [soil metagenome]
MTTEWSAPAWAVLATLAVLGVLLVAVPVALRRARERTSALAADLLRVHADSAALQAPVAALDRRLAARTPRSDDQEYKITLLGDEPQAEGEAVAAGSEDAPLVPAPLFADLVLREGVVQAASFAAGLRRALAPEVRNRIRFEMRREVKRARKQRRADLRRARQDVEARRRAGFEDAEGSAA